jgi:hypothetical protein
MLRKYRLSIRAKPPELQQVLVGPFPQLALSRARAWSAPESCLAIPKHRGRPPGDESPACRRQSCSYCRRFLRLTGFVAAFGSPNEGRAGVARDAALRECSGMSRPYGQTTSGTMETYVFRSCMAQRGHVE